MSCAAAFNSLAIEPDVRETMILEGAVPALIVLTQSSLRKIKNDCTRALCNLAAGSGYEEEVSERASFVPKLQQKLTNSTQFA